MGEISWQGPVKRRMQIGKDEGKGSAADRYSKDADELFHMEHASKRTESAKL